MPKPRQYMRALSTEERAQLTKLARSRSADPRQIRRAKIILMAVDGAYDRDIAAKLGISQVTVHRLIKNWFEQGVDEALKYLPRHGRTRVILDDARMWVANLACQCPSSLPDGPDEPMWTLASLSQYVKQHCLAANFPELKTAAQSLVRSILIDPTLPTYGQYFFKRRKLKKKKQPAAKKQQ